MIPTDAGPTWAYSSGGLLIVLQYYVWALEMSSYWFRPESDKVKMLNDVDLITKWKKLCQYWGAGLSSLTIGMFQGSIDNYLAAKTARIWVSATFAI